MAKTLAEIIADAASADDLTFTGPDGVTFKLADVRGVAGSSAAEKKILAEKIRQAEDIGKQANDMLSALNEAMKKQTPEKTPEKKAESWREDPLYAPMAPVFDELKGIAEAARSEAASLKKSLDQSQAIYSIERMRRQWAEAKSKPKDMTFEQAVQQVVASKEFDEFGLPTIEKFLHRSTEQERMDAYAATKIAEKEKEWNEKQRLSNIQKPSNTKFNVRDKGAAPIAKLDELTSDKIASDPDILKAMEMPIQ